METRQLRYFVSVAEHGNFTRAARSLHIAQPALSIAIKKMEAGLGLVLFDRNEKQVHLTHEGKVLLEHARRILQQVKDAEAAVAELKGLTKGEVRIGVPGMMGSYFFPQILMAFRSRYPNLKLTVIEAGTQSIRDMLLKGELDLGVIIDKDVPAPLATQHLLTASMVAVVSDEHPFASREVVSFDEFFSEELIMFKAGYFHREFIDKVCREHGFQPNFAFETNLLAMILKIVRGGYAITALLDLVTDREDGITGIPFEHSITLELGIAWRKEGYLTLADRTFIEFLREQLKETTDSKTA